MRRTTPIEVDALKNPTVEQQTSQVIDASVG
jgi:hypothetical protein